MNIASRTLFEAVLKSNSFAPVLLEGYSFEHMQELIGATVAPQQGEPLVSLNLQESLGIEEVRKVISQLHKKSISERRVVFYHAHEFRSEAANALLKLLEEPPTQTRIILTSLPYGTLPTIRSRCMIVKCFDAPAVTRQSSFFRRPLAEVFQDLSDFNIEEGRRILNTFIHEARMELLGVSSKRAAAKANVLRSALSLLHHGALSKIALQNIFVAWKYA